MAQQFPDAPEADHQTIQTKYGPVKTFHGCLYGPFRCGRRVRYRKLFTEKVVLQYKPAGFRFPALPRFHLPRQYPLPRGQPPEQLRSGYRAFLAVQHAFTAAQRQRQNHYIRRRRRFQTVFPALQTVRFYPAAF